MRILSIYENKDQLRNFLTLSNKRASLAIESLFQFLPVDFLHTSTKHDAYWLYHWNEKLLPHLNKKRMLLLFPSSVNNDSSISTRSFSYSRWTNCALYGSSNKCSVIIRYVVVVSGIEEASTTDRTFDPGWVWRKSLTSSTFSWLILVSSPNFNTPTLTKSFKYGSDPRFSWCIFAEITLPFSFYNCTWFKFIHE